MGLGCSSPGLAFHEHSSTRTAPWVPYGRGCPPGLGGDARVRALSDSGDESRSPHFAGRCVFDGVADR